MGRSMFAAGQEHSLREKQDFKECASGYPTMLVAAPGTFMVGSAEGEQNRGGAECRSMK
jgi:hypothetical protein